MLPADDVTLGELNRKIDGVAGAVKDLTDKLDNYPRWPDVKRIEEQLGRNLRAAIEQRDTVVDGLKLRITDLEAWQAWALRIVVGLVISGVIAAFFIFKP